MASNASQPGHGQVSQRHVCECGSHPAATGLTGETWGHGPEMQWFQISDAGAERGRRPYLHVSLISRRGLPCPREPAEVKDPDR